MLRQVSGSSIMVQPIKTIKSSRFSTPSKEQQDHQIDQIIQKYLGTERTSDTFTSSITTMFHNTIAEEKQLVVSPFKKLTSDDCTKYFDTLTKIQSDKKHYNYSPPQDEFHHLKTSSELSPLKDSRTNSQGSLNEIAQNLEQVFDSPQGHAFQNIEKSPEFFNPDNRIRMKDLPIIEEEDTQQRINGLITQIDNKLIGTQPNSQIIEKIKEKYQPKKEEFYDFPDYNLTDWSIDPVNKFTISCKEQNLSNEKEFRIQAVRQITFNQNDFSEVIQKNQDSIDQKQQENSLVQNEIQNNEEITNQIIENKQNIPIQQITLNNNKQILYQLPVFNVLQSRCLVGMILICQLFWLLMKLL